MNNTLLKNVMFKEVQYDVEKAIDYAFQGKFVLNFYEYLKVKGAIKKIVEDFLNSNTVCNITEIIIDLDTYLEGGSDNQHKQLREAYGYLPKPQARKIRDYLNKILEDAQKYNYDKRKGRRKKETK
jgi:hypothetical protein